MGKTITLFGVIFLLSAGNIVLSYLAFPEVKKATDGIVGMELIPSLHKGAKQTKQLQAVDCSKENEDITAELEEAMETINALNLKDKSKSEEIAAMQIIINDIENIKSASNKAKNQAEAEAAKAKKEVADQVAKVNRLSNENKNLRAENQRLSRIAKELALSRAEIAKELSAVQSSRTAPKTKNKDIKKEIIPVSKLDDVVSKESSESTITEAKPTSRVNSAVSSKEVNSTVLVSSKEINSTVLKEDTTAKKDIATVQPKSDQPAKPNVEASEKVSQETSEKVSQSHVPLTYGWQTNGVHWFKSGDSFGKLEGKVLVIDGKAFRLSNHSGRCFTFEGEDEVCY